MILVHGREPSLVSDVVGKLTSEGHTVATVERADELFEAVVRQRAKLVIALVAPTQRTEPSLGAEEVDALIAASNAPAPPVVVLVSPLASDAPPVRRLKKSGAAYILVPSPAPSEALGDLHGRIVWVARAVARSDAALVTRAALLGLIARATREDAPVGTSLQPEPASWESVLREAGARVRMVPSWLARAAALCGQRAVCVDAYGRPEPRLERARTRTLRSPLRLSSSRAH